jgi:hypothetical protein
MNEKKRAFFKEEGGERIQRAHVRRGPSSIIPAIMSAIVDFRGTAPQAIDRAQVARSPVEFWQYTCRSFGYLHPVNILVATCEECGAGVTSGGR